MKHVGKHQASSKIPMLNRKIHLQLHNSWAILSSQPCLFLFGDGNGWCTSMPLASFEAPSCDLTKRLMDVGLHGWLRNTRCLVTTDYTKLPKNRNKLQAQCFIYTKLLIQIAHHLFLLPSFAAIAAIQEWKDRFERLQERFPMLSTLAGCN